MKQFNSEDEEHGSSIFNSSKAKYKGSKYNKEFQQENVYWFMGLSV
jgi:hypothetical protein